MKPYIISVAFLVLLTPRIGQPDVLIEYIGHASFVIESPQGVRVVIDPFNSNRWLGYRYPASVEADVVLVTHPHYDHDASYYWGSSVPVFREPSSYGVGDVSFVGVEGKHADPYGEDFGQKNTIWVLDAGGVRVAHLGDNGPLTEKNVRELGRVDVLMVPADGDGHILKPAEIAAARESLGDPLVIPMHYRLDGFLNLPQSLGPVDPWLATQKGVVRLKSHRTRIGNAREPGRDVLVFQPSPELRVWSEELREGWSLLDQARELMASGPDQMPQAGALVNKAAEVAECIVFEFQWARVVAGSGDTDKAIALLEAALARAGRDDWQYRMSSRSLLADLYAKSGRAEDAAAQHRIVLEKSYRTELLDKASAFLATH